MLSPLFYRHKDPADDQRAADEDVGGQGFAEGEDAGEGADQGDAVEKVVGEADAEGGDGLVPQMIGQGRAEGAEKEDAAPGGEGRAGQGLDEDFKQGAREQRHRADGHDTEGQK